MRSSLQQTAGPSKATKFVNANPLDPMLRPFGNGGEDDMQAALADKINRQLERDTSSARTVAPVVHPSAEHAPGVAPIQQQPPQSIPARPSPPHHEPPPTMDFNNQPHRGGAHCDDDESDDDDAHWLNDDDDTNNNKDPVLQAIRHRRLQELQQQHAQRLALVAKGHGQVRTISQDEFLPECIGTSSSEFVVVHFFHKEYPRCEILDHHLQRMAPWHVECKFLRLDAEKAPFFVAKLHVKMLPTLVVFQDGKVVDRMTGFDKLLSSSDKDADPDAWETSRLQVWLATTGAVQYTAAPATANGPDDWHRVGYRSRIYRGDGMDDNDDM